MYARGGGLQRDRGGGAPPGLSVVRQRPVPVPVHLRPVTAAGRQQGNRQFAGRRPTFAAADGGGDCAARQRQPIEFERVARPRHPAEGESKGIGGRTRLRRD